MIQSTFLTRMHSSRMRTGHSLTVSWSLLPGGGCMLPGGVSSGGGVYSRGVSAPVGPALGVVVSQHALRQTPLWTESQTPVKTLPWPNFVAAGSNGILNGILTSTIEYNSVKRRIVDRGGVVETVTEGEEDAQVWV